VRLVDELALLVSHTPIEHLQGQERARVALIGSQLPKLLHDSVYRDQLLRPEGVARRLIREALKGRGLQDKEQPYAFSAEDLPTAVRAINDAGKDAKAIFAQLAGSPPLREAASGILNDYLESALAHVLQIGETRLSDLMIDLRRALHVEGRELVLLIEDFTLLQGIQRSLLDALTEPAIREGVQELCTIRTAMAVTSGYFEKLGVNTFMTRADFAGGVYNVDLQYGADLSEPQVESFVGQYLNAARLNPVALRTAYLNRKGANWVPNQCSDCPCRLTCHAAFGASPNQYGMYPFNSRALARMVQEVGLRNGVFEPRAVLGRILRQTLGGQADDIEEGQFPSLSYIEMFGSNKRLDPEVHQVLRELPDGDRHIALAEYWGTEDGNLDPRIYTAFQISPPILPSAPAMGGPTPTPRRQPSRAEPKEKLDDRLIALQKWRNGNQLEQRIARDMRDLLHNGVNVSIASVADSWRAAVSDRWGLKQGSFRLANAKGGIPLSSSDIALDVAAGDREFSALRGILLFETTGSWSFENGGRALRNYCSVIDDLAEIVLAKTPHGRIASNPDLVFELQFLLAGGSVLDPPAAKLSQDASLMRAAFSTESKSAARSRGAAWAALIDRLWGIHEDDSPRTAAQQEIMSVVGLSQGEGQPRAIDASDVIEILEHFKHTWVFAHPNRSDLRGEKAAIERLLADALKEQRAAITRTATALGETFGLNSPIAQTLGQIETLITTAKDLQVLRPENAASSFRQACLRINPESVRAQIEKLVQTFETADTHELVVALADSAGAELVQTVDRLVDSVSDLLRETAGRVDEELRGAQLAGVQEKHLELLASVETLRTVLADK